MLDQLDLNFPAPDDTSSPSSGLDVWRAHRRDQMEKLAVKQGLPLGHWVRVEFENGPPLEGRLVLNEETLFCQERPQAKLHLRIGDADFHADEISSCIRIDPPPA